MRHIALLLLSMMFFASFSVFANGFSEKTASSVTVTSEQLSDAKTLIVYFSPANSDGVDFVSSATPRVDGVSSVEYLANLIGSQVKADAAKIVPREPYPLPYNDTADKAKKEQNNNERPAFSLDVNPEDYDIIFVGYPIWWYHLPMIMQSFFAAYDFSGKTVIPFMTHQGSRDGGTFKEIRQLESESTVVEGIAVRGDHSANADDDVKKWLSGLGY